MDGVEDSVAVHQEAVAVGSAAAGVLRGVEASGAEEALEAEAEAEASVAVHHGAAEAHRAVVAASAEDEVDGEASGGHSLCCTLLLFVSYLLHFSFAWMPVAELLNPDI